MSEQGRSYADALAEAQRRGYAEADPTLDVDGTDAAHKLAILAQIAFGVAVPLAAIERRGIAGIDSRRHPLRPRAGLHHQAAGRGLARTDDGSWPCTSRRCCCGTRRRWPRCAAPTTPSTSSATRSATRSTTAAAPGRCRPPAPSSPTSSTWPSAGPSGPSRRCGCGRATGAGIALRPPSTVRSRFYLRLLVEDRPGVLAEIAARPGRPPHQHLVGHPARGARRRTRATRVPLVIMTHTAPTGSFRAAVGDIDRLRSVTAAAFITRWGIESAGRQPVY